jgi:hypothetical protein
MGGWVGRCVSRDGVCEDVCVDWRGINATDNRARQHGISAVGGFGDGREGESHRIGPSSHLSIVAVAEHQRPLRHHAVAQVQAGQEGFELHGHVAARVAVGGEGVEGRHATHGCLGGGAEEVAEVGAAAAVLEGQDGGDDEGVVVWVGGVECGEEDGEVEGVEEGWKKGWKEGWNMTRVRIGVWYNDQPVWYTVVMS